MGTIITSPTAHEFKFTDFARPLENGHQRVFLAGGISNCPDWQSGAAEKIARETHLTVYNPRRIGWNMEAYEEDSRAQIEWEFYALRACSINLFWFPCETLCPITLLELGSALEREGAVIVGTHPDYERRFDILEQTRLRYPFMTVYDNLDETVNVLIESIKGK